MKHLMTQENEWDVVMGGKVGMEMCVCVGGVSGGGGRCCDIILALIYPGNGAHCASHPSSRNCLSVYRSEEEEQEKTKQQLH